MADYNIQQGSEYYQLSGKDPKKDYKNKSTLWTLVGVILVVLLLVITWFWWQGVQIKSPATDTTVESLPYSFYKVS